MQVPVLALAAVALTAAPASAQLNLGADELVQVSGMDIDVPGYSVPSYVLWDGDAVPDLVVGQGSGYVATEYPKVRVYLNQGTAANPVFTNYFFAQANGVDLQLVGGGCMGLFPRVTYWDADARKDLLVGESEGKILIFLNIGTDAAPTFDGGTYLQVGAPGAKVDIDVGQRPTPCIVDWDNDGRRDLVIGDKGGGRLAIYRNEGTDTAPDYRTVSYVQEYGSDLVVPSFRSSPEVRDLDGDGRKDLLVGNTNGQILFYANLGTDAAPTFGGYVEVTAAGVAIDLPGTPRSRPFLVDWTGDGLLDLLVGSGDGNVHLYQGMPALIPTVPEWGLIGLSLVLVAAGAWHLQRRARVA